jgi:hypothetical protein
MWENPTATRIDDKGNPIGHVCKIKFRKSVNEKTGATVRYPIRYGMTGGKSVWVEREIVDMMRLWGFIEQKGSWINFDEDLLEDLKKAKIECPDKIQGEQKIVNLLEEDKKLKKFMLDYISKEFNKIK